LKFNSPVLQVNNFFSGLKKKENKPIKPDIIPQMNYQEIDKKNDEKYKEYIHYNEININNKDISINEKNKNYHQKKLVNSSSIRNLISTPPKGKKFKLDKNNSFLNIKGEANLFTNNNIQNINHNDTNLSSLLSSNSIINFNYVSKINGINMLQNNKDKKSSIRNPSNDYSTSNINALNNVTNYNKNNSIIDDKAKKRINQLYHDFSCKELLSSNSGRNQCMSGRNKSNLKIKLKGDNSYRLNSLSPRTNHHDNNSENRKIGSKNSIREFKPHKNKNYIQLRQTNLDNTNNLISYYLPNLNKLNQNKKLFNQFNYDEFKKKGKINLSNLYNFLKNKKKSKKEEKYFILRDKNKINSKIKRSGSTLLFNSEMKLDPKLNSILNKNHGNNREIINHNKNTTFREKKLRRNASDIF
jgi:hypothetical protein